MLPEDAELINQEIPNFLAMYMLFGSGVIPGSCRRRRRSVNVRGTGPPSTIHAKIDEDDVDDDFMPPISWCSSSNTEEGSRNSTRGRPRTSSRWHKTNIEIGRARTMITQDDDDDDDFMPQRRLPPRPTTTVDIDDPEDDGGFACTRPYNYQSPPRRR